MNQAATSASTVEATSDATLHGLSPETWGGKALLNQELVFPVASRLAGSDQPTSYARISGIAKFPLTEDRPPVEVRIFGKDFGKRGLKGSGVNGRGYFRTTVVPDAYCVANEHLQQEAITDELGAAIYTWRVSRQGERPRTGERFMFGTPAIRLSDALAVNDDVATRLADDRTHDMLVASLVLDLMELGLSPVEGESRVVKKHDLLVALGVPARDLKNPETSTAANALKGIYSVEQTDVASGKVTIWLIEIAAVFTEAQPKGTLFAATRLLGGSPALDKKIITVIDIGGGDIYEYEIDLQGGLLASPKRLGDGTIVIARFLAARVEEEYGIQISEIAAQEALYTRMIWKGGDQISIAHLIEELRPRFADLLTKMTITNRMLTTFIIVTGGGAALLADEIRARILAKSKKLQEGTDFLIMPAPIAAIANVIGLFAIGMYKVQKLIRDSVAAYLDLQQEERRLDEQIRGAQVGAQRWVEEQGRLAPLQGQLQALRARLSAHVAQFYPEIQKQVRAQRQSQQAPRQQSAG